MEFQQGWGQQSSARPQMGGKTWILGGISFPFPSAIQDLNSLLTPKLEVLEGLTGTSHLLHACGGGSQSLEGKILWEAGCV